MRVRTEAELIALCDRAIAGEELAVDGDPLGEAFCRLRDPATRRQRGATYTPLPVVRAMVDWAAGELAAPGRVIDPGCGSARFLVEAGRRFPDAELIGVEIDPLAARCARAHLAAAGMSRRAVVVEGDYRDAALPDPAPDRPSLFVGNPPYVRHHDIDGRWKAWLGRTARRRGLRASKLAGLHVHFLLATAERARDGDAGCFITAAEWLDVNYGVLPRALLAGPLGGVRIDLVDATAQLFDDAQTTSVIVGFRPGEVERSLRVRRVRSSSALTALRGGRTVARARASAESRWSGLARAPRLAPKSTVGDRFRVHRGQVTGANKIWIAPDGAPPVPARFLLPAITRARELIEAAPRLARADRLRRVVDLPVELDRLADDERQMVDRFLGWARERGADAGYIARHRSPWWRVGLRAPAPILCTYMARRPPVFVRNAAGARHVNIAHGLYPREPMSDGELAAVIAHLSSAVDRSAGRTYAGGLTKFEPGELARLPLPPIEQLLDRAAA